MARFAQARMAAAEWAPADAEWAERLQVMLPKSPAPQSLQR
jgi:hypothetical protein